MIDYQNLLRAQRAFFMSGKTLPATFRKEQLLKLASEIKKRHADIEASLKEDLGKGEFEAFATEVTAVLDVITEAIRDLDVWLKPTHTVTPPILGEGESRIYHDPYGVALIINTWNYPFVLCFKPLVGAIAAGNCIIVKPSEVAPTTSKVLAEIINNAFDAAYCHAIEGGAEETTTLLQEQFDIIFYTGSARVGKIVAQAAARHLTPTVLELGGKSPCIIDKSADIERTVPTLCWGKFMNAGQTCTAPDYIYAHTDIKEKLITALGKQIHTFYGDDIKTSNYYGRIVNKYHFQRLTHLMQEGNIRFGGDTDESQRYISPTIIDSIDWNSPIMQEEIFGPLLPILTFTDYEDVITELKPRSKPLALYIYTSDPSITHEIITRLQYGGGSVNSTLMHMLNSYLPFGGIGECGHGAYGGKYSFEAFSHKKGIFHRKYTDDSSPLLPPYEGKTDYLRELYL